MRAEFQIIVIPYVMKENQLKVAVFQRKIKRYWQFVSGGGENNETLIETAIREVKEEVGYKTNSSELIKLDSMCTISKENFKEHKDKKNIYVIPEYSFCMKMVNDNIILSKEHIDYKWLNVDEVFDLLTFDSNKTALWELSQKIIDGVITK